MSKLVKLLLYCAIFVFSDGSDCPLHDVFLNNSANSLIYTRHTNGTITTESISCPENTVFSAAQLKCVEVPELNVKCTRSGRILDTSSNNCTTYLICTQLEDGSYDSKQVKCPIGMVFSPNVSRCVSANNYICPRSYENLRSNGCEGNGRFADPFSTNCSTYVICTQLEDGSYSSKQIKCPIGMVFSPNVSRCVSVNNYICPESHGNIQSDRCQGNGRFSDPLSVDCSSYLNCTQLEDGSYSSNKVNCPAGNLFSPTVSLCIAITNYNCPITKIRTSGNFQSSECHDNGRFPDSSSINCTSYQVCTQLDDGSYSSNRVMCPIGTLFSAIASRCISNSNYTCPGIQNKTHENLQSLGCLGNGRYPDPKAFNCSSYLICTHLGNGNYSSTEVTCPSGTKFSANFSRCISSTNYTCPGYETQDTGCLANGRFPDPSSVNCSSYLICTHLKDGSYSSNQVFCPTGTLFSRIVNRCISSLNYTCSTAKNETHGNLFSSRCQGNGRFPEPNSINCTSYQLCTQLDDGSYFSKQVSCPSGTLFSSIVKRCVSNSSYICPRHSNGCRGNGRFSDPNSANRSSYLICTQLANGTYSSSHVTCPPSTVFSSDLKRCVLFSDYTCSSEGLFSDPNSIDCSSYISCSKDLVPQTLKCPKYTLFSIEKHDCIIACDVMCHGTHNKSKKAATG